MSAQSLIGYGILIVFGALIWGASGYIVGGIAGFIQYCADIATNNGCVTVPDVTPLGIRSHQ
jgi:hypothetical protein